MKCGRSSARCANANNLRLPNCPPLARGRRITQKQTARERERSRSPRPGGMIYTTASQFSASPTRLFLRVSLPSPEQLPQLPSVLLSVSEGLFQLRHLRHSLLLHLLLAINRLLRYVRPRRRPRAQDLARLDRPLQPILHDERETRPRGDLR